jgi:Ca2+-binding EF-hand superfamily protein
MKVIQIVTMAALTLGLTQLAYANHDGADGKNCAQKKHSLQDSDTNKDGAISRDEFMSARQAPAEEHFAKMDANKDGKIDQAERDAMKAKWEEHHKKPEVKPEAK